MVSGEIFARRKKTRAAEQERGAIGQQDRIDTGQIGVEVATEGLEFYERP